MFKTLGVGSVCFGMMIVLCGCPPSNSNGPTADFSADVATGNAALTVHFSDMSKPVDSPVTAWVWLFGDGGTSTVQNPTHIYTTAGQYNVSLTVTSADGTDTMLKFNFVTVTAGGEGEEDVAFSMGKQFGYGYLGELTLSSDGTYCLTEGAHFKVYLWNMATGTCVQSFSGHEDAIQSLVLSPDDTQVLTGSQDGTAKLWDVSTGAEIRTFSGQLQLCVPSHFLTTAQKC